MRGFVAEDTKVGVPSMDIESDARKAQRSILTKGLRDNGRVGDNVRPAPAPPLQRDTTGDMLRMYAEEDAVLDDLPRRTRRPARSASRSTGPSRSWPRRGLPHRDTPADKVDKDLPYPARSTPYMANPDPYSDPTVKERP